MSKKSREAIKDNLARVLEPPAATRKRGAHLDGLLDEYAPPEKSTHGLSSMSSAAPANQSAGDNVAAAARNESEPRPQAAADTQSGEDQLAGAAYQSGALDLSNLLPRDTICDKWTPTPNDITDVLQPLLKPQDYAVLTRLYRLAQGFKTNIVRVSNPRLAKACNVSERDLRRILSRLEGHCLIKRIETDFANKNQAERGMILKINLPMVSVKGQAKPTGAAYQSGAAKLAGADRLAPNKEKALKEKDIKGNSPKVTRLTPEDKQETIEMITELITKSGYSFEQAETQFGGNLTSEDWAAIRARVEGQEVKS